MGLVAAAVGVSAPAVAEAVAADFTVDPQTVRIAECQQAMEMVRRGMMTRGDFERVSGYGGVPEIVTAEMHNRFPSQHDA